MQEGSKLLESVTDFFKENNESFTIYVVEQRFVVGRGADYFRSFKGKENYIDTNNLMKNRLTRIIETINKHIPNTAELIKHCFVKLSPMGIIDIISSLSKLFSVNEHQAAGPEVIDPIIIQEGNILPKYINQIISLHKSSILRPVIIILLKDNDFDRAKNLLSGCPHNTNIKMIRNSGKTEIYKVINCGANSPDEFLDAFAHHCFSTCSNTRRDIICNEEWAENSIVKQYSPAILQMRTNLLFKDKTLIRTDLDNLVTKVSGAIGDSNYDNTLLRSFECIVRLFRVFCNDGGYQDIQKAYNIAKNLDNEILLAHVYRCSYFLEQFSFSDRIKMMEVGHDIFSQNGMEDHAIYCKNNALVRQFDLDSVSITDFLSLQEEAIYNVPGLVGMSHILNNVGAAHLMNGYPEDAIDFFEKGLDYAYRPERCIQKAALLTNRLIAKSYCFFTIEEDEIFKVMNLIFDNKELLNLPFLSARYALNTISVAFKYNTDLGKELLNLYPVGKLICQSLLNNKLGSGQLLLQIDILKNKYREFKISESIRQPEHVLDVTGMRKQFIMKNGYNPALFSTWF